METGTIAMDVYGGGPETFLLLHGIPGNRDVWRRVAGDLGRDATVLVPDLLGFGASTRPPSSMHALGHARSLRELLDIRADSAVHLAGFDFGGPIACALANLAPDRVRTLTLLATNLFPDTPIPAPLKIARVPLAGSVAFRILMGKWGLSLMWLAAVANKRSFPWRRYRAMLEEPCISSTRQIFLHSLRHLDELYRPIQETLSGIGVPCRVIWGDRDPFFATAVGRRVATAIPGSEYVEVANCGHFIPEEYPELVARELRRVASAVAGASGV